MRKFILPIGLIALTFGVVFVLRHSRTRAAADRSREGLTTLAEVADPRSDSAERPGTAPEFAEGSPWLQSKPLTLASLRGRVVVVHFWTFGCVNCQHNYPVYKGWLEKYKDKKVTVIGVHTPEFKREADADRVLEKAKDNGLKFPIVLDNDSAIWNAWGIRYWPTILLVDKKGVVRYHWEGELHLDKADAKQFAEHIDQLLAE
jgi:thiol-disulfide isomerase/thioredoxin